LCAEVRFGAEPGRDSLMSAAHYRRK